MSLVNLIKQYNDQKKALQDRVQAELKVEFAKFFELHPVVKLVAWQQYTPYFNDGDPCTFRVGTASLFTMEDPEEIYEGSDEEIDRSKYRGTREELPADQRAAVEYFEEHLEPIVAEEDLMLGVFGDHVQIKATAAGFDVDEYDHE